MAKIQFFNQFQNSVDTLYYEEVSLVRWTTSRRSIIFYTGPSNLLTTQPNHSVSSVASADNVLLNSNNNHTSSQQTQQQPFTASYHTPNTTSNMDNNTLSTPSTGGYSNDSKNNSTIDEVTSEPLFENSFDVPDISAVPKPLSFKRSSAVSAVTVGRKVSVGQLEGTELSQTEPGGGGVDEEDGEASECLPFNSIEVPVVDPDTDSIGDVLEDELPENREFKQQPPKYVHYILNQLKFIGNKREFIK